MSQVVNYYEVLRPFVPLLSAAAVAAISQFCTAFIKDHESNQLPPSSVAVVELVRALLTLLAASTPALAGLAQGDTASIIAQCVVIWLVSHGYIRGGTAVAVSMSAVRRK